MRAPAEHPRLKRPTAIGLASPDAVPMRRDTGPVRARYWSRGPARPAFPRSTAEHAEILANEGHERHETVADSGDLPDPESDLSVELRADRIDYAHPATDGVVAAAAGRHVYGPAADAVLARRGHGVHARRTAAALIGGQARDASDRGGADGRRIVGVSPGVVSRGEDGVRRAARSRAVGVSGRRQLRIVFGPAPGGIRRRPPGSAEHRVVLAAGAGRDRPAVQGGPMV